MGALEHSSNAIWHTASAPSLEAKILCTLLNVHKLVSLFKDYAYRQIMLMTSFLVIVFKTTLASKSKRTPFARRLELLVHTHTSDTHHLLCDSYPVHMYVFLCM